MTLHIKPLLKSPRASTLVEVIITTTLFAMIATAAISLLVTTMRSTKRIQLTAYLYNEAQILMDVLANDVSKNALDYEAYFDRNVLKDLGWDCATIGLDDCWDTKNYGYYGKAFYHPGEINPATGTRGPDYAGPYGSAYSTPAVSGYGQDCPGEPGYLYPYECDPDLIRTDSPDINQADINTGKNPFGGIQQFIPSSSSKGNSASAFCSPLVVEALIPGSTDPEDDENCVLGVDQYQKDLILISGKGDYRKIYTLRRDQLVRIGLVGTDVNTDGLVDTWRCDTSVFTCDLAPKLSQFVSTHPGDLSIRDFTVLVSPGDDPYKAYLELDESIQPQVTIFLTVALNRDGNRNFLGRSPEITLERTVSTGVYNEIVTYE